MTGAAELVAEGGGPPGLALAPRGHGASLAEPLPLLHPRPPHLLSALAYVDLNPRARLFGAVE